MARWLSEEEQAAWRAVAALTLRLPGALDRQLIRDDGMTFFEYMVISSLSMEPGRTQPMSDLARLAGGSLTRLSNTAKRLEERGWITRRADPESRRRVLATLTDEGWDAVVAAAPGHVEAVRSLVIDPLTATQVSALSRLGSRLAPELD